MKQAWQIPAAVGATAVLTFAGVSVLQANANGPVRALGASLRGASGPTPASVELGEATAAGSEGSPGAPGAYDVLAQEVWRITGYQPAAPAGPVAEAAGPPLRWPLPGLYGAHDPEGASHDGGAEADGPAPDVVGGARDAVPDAAPAKGHGSGADEVPAGMPETARVDHREDAADAAQPVRAVAPPAVTAAAAGTAAGPAVVTGAQNGWTGWGTSPAWLDKALRAAANASASGQAQQVTVGNGKGQAKAVGRAIGLGGDGQQGRGGN